MDQDLLQALRNITREYIVERQAQDEELDCSKITCVMEALRQLKKYDFNQDRPII